jgi:hypothetical protein
MHAHHPGEQRYGARADNIACTGATDQLYAHRQFCTAPFSCLFALLKQTNSAQLGNEFLRRGTILGSG